MDQKDRIDLLLDVIKRFDFYINSTNTKASLIIAWNGIVTGAVLLKYDDILRLYNGNPKAVQVAIVLLVGIGLLAAVSNIIVFWVVFPFLKSTSDETKKKTLPIESIFFFTSVAKLDSKTYFEKISGSDDEILRDLSDQAVVVASGLAAKMHQLRNSIWLIAGQLFFLSCLLILKAFL